MLYIEICCVGGLLGYSHLLKLIQQRISSYLFQPFICANIHQSIICSCHFLMDTFVLLVVGTKQSVSCWMTPDVITYLVLDQGRHCCIARQEYLKENIQRRSIVIKSVSLLMKGIPPELADRFGYQHLLLVMNSHYSITFQTDHSQSV